MNVGVVTPKMDGMNLVAKEMVICNPNAALVLSAGAGTDAQLGKEGFYSDKKKLYYRVADVCDTNAFAETFYEVRCFMSHEFRFDFESTF